MTYDTSERSVRVRVYTGFESLPAGYEALFDAAAESSFFIGRPWFTNLHAATEGPHRAIRLYGVELEPSNEPIAVLPMWTGTPRRPLFGATELGSLTNQYSVAFDIVTRPDEPRLSAIAAAIASRLRAERRPRWDKIVLKGLDVHGRAFPALTEALRAAGFFVQPFFCFGNWYQDTNGVDFETYEKGLPNQVRNTLKRRMKRLSRVDHSFSIVTDRPGLEGAMEDYLAVYAKSWKEPERFRSFIQSLMATCAGRGTLRLGILYIEGKPAAAQVWITAAGAANIYKLAYDEAYKDYSAGSLLTAHLMRYALDTDHVHTVDYGQGDDPYKKDWLSSRRERWGIAAFNPRTALGLAHAVQNIAGRAIKQRLGRTLP
ncbi:MAG: GNAT family N-acetyltransferase [Gammaproteobacteria bacterium]